jgi:hypothetical protein
VQRALLLFVVAVFPLLASNASASGVPGSNACKYLLEDEIHASQFRSVMRGNIQDFVGNLSTLEQRGIWNAKRAYAYRRLGFRFESGNVEVPLPNRFFENYEALLEEFGIQKNARLLPARIYRDRAGKMKALKFYRKAPEGWMPDPRPVSHVEYIRLLRNGFFPLFEPQKTQTANNSWHDISHLVGWLLYPEYANAFRAAVRRLEHLPEESLNPARTALGRRINFVLEWMAYPRVSKPELLNALEIDSLLETEKQVTAEAVERWLRSEPGRVGRLGRKFQQGWFRLAENYGGASDDAIAFLFREGSPLRGGILPFTQGMSSYLHLANDVLKQDMGNEALLAPHLARAYAYLLEVSKTTPERLVKEAMEPEVDRSSSFYRVFCASGITLDATYRGYWGC